MKFVRHLLAATAVVAVVVALGFVWSWTGAASLIADGRGDRPPPTGAPAPTGSSGTEHSRDRRFDDRGSGGVSLTNIDDLGQTLFIEAAIVGGVVAIDLARRRRRQQRRGRPEPT